jgi:hypothetical protein
MNDNEKEMHEKLKKMNKDELLQYHTASTFAGRVIDVLGILTILYMLVFTSFASIIIGGITVYVFANMASTLVELIDFIEKRITKLQDK